jgi:hypothetical protein
VPLDANSAANGMTVRSIFVSKKIELMHALQQAIYVPDGLKPSDIVPKLASRGVTIAAGLHKDIKEKYVRIGTMGVTVVDAQRGDVDRGALLPLSPFAQAEASSQSSRPCARASRRRATRNRGGRGRGCNAGRRTEKEKGET